MVFALLFAHAKIFTVSCMQDFHGLLLDLFGQQNKLELRDKYIVTQEQELTWDLAMV